jgi:hypothetical protein
MTSCDAKPSDSKEVFGVFGMFGAVGGQSDSLFEPIRSAEIESLSLIADKAVVCLFDLDLRCLSRIALLCVTFYE